MRTINILLADDDPGHRYLLSRAIADGRPYVQIETVENYQAFVTATSDRRFDCAVIDFNLSDGFHADDLVSHLHNVQPDCPVLIVSGSDDQRVAVTSFRCGGADFMHKDDAVQDGVLWARIQSVVKHQCRRAAERRKHQRRESQLREMAETDALTGLANRRTVQQLFDDPTRKVLDRREDASVIMLDIDHFKTINDTHGHATGDRILHELGSLMRDHAGSRDVAARWGGEEFLVIRPRTGLVEAVRWAEKLRQEIEQSISCDDHGCEPVTASFGVYSVSSAEFAMDAIERADGALYLAKHRGRNRVCTWGPCQFESAIPDDATLTPEGRLDLSLQRLMPGLGPTQVEHLTSHSNSVSTAAMLVGLSADLDIDTLDAVRIAGLCHDIGKVAIPESVLSKPGPLDASERFLVDMHADDGAYLCEKLGVSRRAAAMVRDSHVRHDDPRCTPSDPGASALAVADAYVAMTSDRPYQRKYSMREAFEELRRERGGQFDPRAVDACVACYSK